MRLRWCGEQGNLIQCDQCPSKRREIWAHTSAEGRRGENTQEDIDRVKIKTVTEVTPLS